MIDLPYNDIHLWFTEPQNCQDQTLLERYKLLLTDDETEKQQRYIFDKDKHDALVTRAFIRDLLSQYMDRAPEEWHFEKGEKDKPEIINPDIPLRFNISHTKNLIICAVTLEHDIGCDVEHIERSNDVLAIADRFFSKSEVKSLFSLPESEQRDRFFDFWTLKESYIKAWGQGLAIPLSDFSFHIKITDDPLLNNNIHLSFDENRKDNAAHWESWLLYPNAEHRVAISIRNTCLSDNRQKSTGAYNLRYFETVPLLGYKEQIAGFTI